MNGGSFLVDKRVGKRIQKSRENAKISQEKLAEIVGMSVTAISNIERGNNYPSFENFIKIANAIGVSTDILLCDVVESAQIARASELSEKLKNIPVLKRNELYIIIEALLEKV